MLELNNNEIIKHFYLAVKMKKSHIQNHSLCQHIGSLGQFTKHKVLGQSLTLASEANM